MEGWYLGLKTGYGCGGEGEEPKLQQTPSQTWSITTFLHTHT